MISVIVPVYKVEPYLRQCIESIVNQTYRDLEILLIDDGSPDRCREICEEYKEKDERIRVFHNEVNRGLSAARNVGLKKAKGEYIGFVDSDDWIELDMYEVLLKALEANSADIALCDECEKISSSIIAETCCMGRIEAMKALLDGRMRSTVWNKLFRRELFQSVYFPEGRNYEDDFIMHRIIDLCTTITALPDHKYHHNLRSESISKTNTAKNLIDYADAYFDRYRFCLENYLGQFEKEKVLMCTAQGISKVWRWWYGCNNEAKEQYRDRIEEYRKFANSQFPLLGYRSWPSYYRISTMFAHSSSVASFAVLYGINQVFRKMIPRKVNEI